MPLLDSSPGSARAGAAVAGAAVAGAGAAAGGASRETSPEAVTLKSSSSSSSDSTYLCEVRFRLLPARSDEPRFLFLDLSPSSSSSARSN